jgi:hypothetical protein
VTQHAMPEEIKQYQKEGAHFLSKNLRGILADAPGLGKTVQALVALDLTSIGPLDNVLVVAPLSVLPCWQKEAAKWTGWRIFNILRRRDHVPPNPGHILVPWTDLVAMKDRLMPIKWAAIILDEAHRLKQMSSDGQPGWGEVIRDLIGPPPAPLDTISLPANLFADTNREALQSAPTEQNTRQKENPMDPVQNQKGKTVSGCLREIAALVGQLADMCEFQHGAETPAKVETEKPKAEEAKPTAPPAKTEPKAETKTEPAKQETPATKPAQDVPAAAPITGADFASKILPKFLGDPVADREAYNKRRQSVIDTCAKVAGAGPGVVIMPGKLTDIQRGQVAQILGMLA